jgi:hypothetical protein
MITETGELQVCQKKDKGFFGVFHPTVATLTTNKKFSL